MNLSATLVQKLLIPMAGSGGGGSGIDLGQAFTLGIAGKPVRDVYDQPADLVNLVIGNIFWVGGIIYMLTFFYAGFKFIQSGSKGKDEAKQILTAATAGVIIMFVAYWIIKIVEIVTETPILL